ncbi:hypothetical protein [Salinispora sp. H7-4]|uniref:hypothetical protein n=1 Tax=Salinispora sp. H7-4 TaxID=2748321 RepID=UPI002815BD5A|nr:hypothetical protein [Salinispora sp. H7-4]
MIGAPDAMLRAGDPVLAQADGYGSRGLRVLLLARTTGSLAAALETPERVFEGLTPVALIALDQRIRPEAPDTLRYFAEQDVDVKVISGDNPVSVEAVAGRLGCPTAGGRSTHGRWRKTRTGWPTWSNRPRCSAGSAPTRSARWCRPCNAVGTPWR